MRDECPAVRDPGRNAGLNALVTNDADLDAIHLEQACRLLQEVYDNVDLAIDLDPEQLRLVGLTLLMTRCSLESRH